MKKIAPRISDKAAEFLTNNFKTTNSGAEYIIDSMPNLFKFTQFKLKDLFDKQELLLIIDVMNATLLTPELCGRGLQMNVQDGIILDRLDEKWEIDADSLNKKIAELSVFEMFILEFWANGFWYGSEESRDLDKYINDFLS